jgi:hypothetical protein
VGTGPSTGATPTRSPTRRCRGRACSWTPSCCPTVRGRLGGGREGGARARGTASEELTAALPRPDTTPHPTPAGKIVVCNGAQRGVPGGTIDGGSTAKEGAFTAMLYDPDAPEGARMSSLATSGIHRFYHSTALLLPSGDIWVAGSEQGARRCWEPGEGAGAFVLAPLQLAACPTAWPAHAPPRGSPRRPAPPYAPPPAAPPARRLR